MISSQFTLIDGLRWGTMKWAVANIANGIQDSYRE